MKDIINIIALFFILIGVMAIFFKKDVFKSNNRALTICGFVVCLVMLLIIFL